MAKRPDVYKCNPDIIVTSPSEVIIEKFLSKQSKKNPLKMAKLTDKQRLSKISLLSESFSQISTSDLIQKSEETQSLRSFKYRRFLSTRRSARVKDNTEFCGDSGSTIKLSDQVKAVNPRSVPWVIPSVILSIKNSVSILLLS